MSALMLELDENCSGIAGEYRIAGTLPAALAAPLCSPTVTNDPMAYVAKVMAQLTLIEPSAAACGAPYLNMRAFMAVNSKHALLWTTEETANWVFFFGYARALTLY